MRPAAGSGTGPQGRPRRERMTARARRPAETPGIPAETPRHARETRVTCRMETPGLPGAETRGIPAANARHPGGKRVAWRGVNAQIIVRQTITRQVSAPLGGKRRRLAKPAAERTPGGGPGERVWIARSFRVDETVRGAGRGGPHRGPGGGPAGPAGPAISKSQILRSQIPGRSIGNDNYSFTCGPVTRTRSAVAAEWPAYSFSASAMDAATSRGHSSSQLQPIVLHLRRSEDWRHECPRSGSNRHWGPF
jgi:hypothetical protein